jgi:hypothetical protein
MTNFLSWVTHGVKRGRFELDSRASIVLFSSVAALTLVTILYLGLVGRTAAQGRHIERLQVQVFHLQRENERTAVRIAEVCAISRMMRRAEALGFEPAKQVEFLTGSD